MKKMLILKKMRQMSKKFKIVKLENGLYNVVDSERNALFKKEDAPTILFVSNRKPLEEITMFYAMKKQKDGEKKCQKTVFFLNGEDYPEIKWFDDVTVFENDVVLVKLDGKYNVLDKDNTFRFAEWFDNIVSNKMGTVHIALKDGKYNVYDKDFAPCEFELNDFDKLKFKGLCIAEFEKDGKHGYLDLSKDSSKPLYYTNKIYDDINILNVENRNLWKVIKDGKHNIVDADDGFRELFDIDYDYMDAFVQGNNIKVCLGNKCNIANIEGKILFDGQWHDVYGYTYDYIDYDNPILVYDKNRGYNYVTSEGKLLSDVWFERGNHFMNGYAYVISGDACTYINQEGALLFPWMDFDDFELIDDSEKRVVKCRGEYNYINKYGHLTRDEWTKTKEDETRFKEQRRF